MSVKPARRRMSAPSGLDGLKPEHLTLNDLRAWHQRLGAWLDDAEAARPGEEPSEETIETVRTVLAMLTRERRERQSDERRDS